MHDQGLFFSLLILPQSKQLQNSGAEHEVLCLGHGKFSSKQERLCACVDHTKIPVVLPCISESHFLCSVQKVLPAWRGLFITSDRRGFRKIL